MGCVTSKHNNVYMVKSSKMEVYNRSNNKCEICIYNIGNYLHFIDALSPMYNYSKKDIKFYGSSSNIINLCEGCNNIICNHIKNIKFTQDRLYKIIETNVDSEISRLSVLNNIENITIINELNGIE